MKLISIMILGLVLSNPENLCSQSLSNSEEFEVSNKAVRISGSLYFPVSSVGEVPVVIVVPGSARETRESFLPYVPMINKLGNAVIIYDKRGTGKSTGQFINVSNLNSKKTIKLRAQDVGAIVKYAKKHPQINARQIGLLSSSQGVWVAMEVHKLTKDLAFLMNYSGGVASVGLSDHYDELMDDPELSIKEGNSRLGVFNGIHGFNPRSIIKKLKLPTLWVYGALDRSHPILYDVAILQRMNKPNFKVILLENMNHDLMDVATNSISGEMIKASMDYLSSLRRN